MTEAEALPEKWHVMHVPESHAAGVMHALAGRYTNTYSVLQVFAEAAGVVVERRLIELHCNIWPGWHHDNYACNYGDGDHGCMYGCWGGALGPEGAGADPHATYAYDCPNGSHAAGGST